MRKGYLLTFALFIVMLAGCAAPPPVATRVPASPTQAIPTVTPKPTATVEPTATAAPVPSVTPSEAWIRLVPDVGPPGAIVQINGYIPGGPSAETAKGDFGLLHGTACWAGCLSGLTEQTLPVQWSSTQPGQFTMQFTVPEAPWLAADGPHALVPGDYTVGIQCLGPNIGGCALREAQAVTTFHLRGSTPTLCMNEPCASLHLTPSEAPPGTLIQIQGWGPLTDIIGKPFGYSLVLERDGGTGNPPQIGSVQQALNGDISGSFRVPLAVSPLGLLQAGSYTIALEAIRIGIHPRGTPAVPEVTITPLPNGGGERITLAPTAFTLAPAPAWASLGAVHPLEFQDSVRLFDGQAIAVDPANARRIAYCAPGSIQLSTDGGATWSAISTTGVISVAAATPYPLFSPGNESTPVCNSVTLDPSHPRSFYATFSAMKQPYGAPPIFQVGYLTPDAGQTWQALPPPQGYTMDQFGGFQANRQAVQAIFHGQATTPEQASPFTAEQTTDGGRTWVTAQLACPSSGPCVRWGSAPSEIGSMGPDYPQAIEISTDGGRTWTTPAWPGQVILNGGPSELVALSDTEVALLSGPDEYPFRLSRDGGRTWEVIALPALPGSSGYQPLYPGLQMLPDGALLADPQAGQTWQMLRPGASAWCPVTGASLPTTPDLLTVIGDRLWWLESSSAPNAAPMPKNVPISNLRCKSTTK